MGQEEKDKKIDPHYQKYYDLKMPEELNNGPIEERSCRDILCCIIFVLFLAGMVLVAALGFSQGNPDLVLYPYDEDGRQCGRNETTLGYPYLYLYKTMEQILDAEIGNITTGVCVSECPTTFTGTLNCTPTKNNPNCEVTEKNFYRSTSCKLSLFIF
jgi:hypothetical protein